jgi:hypothetical protein
LKVSPWQPDAPLHIHGDFNTVNKTLSMVAGDALYLLSNAWDDAQSNDYDARVASDTGVNAVCMHGLVPSEEGNYSGGVENNFRFLEKWSGRDLRFSGSIVIMWESQKAVGRWRYGNPVYTACDSGNGTPAWAASTALLGPRAWSKYYAQPGKSRNTHRRR